MDENYCSLLVNPAPFYKQHSVGKYSRGDFSLIHRCDDGRSSYLECVLCAADLVAIQMMT